MKTRLMNGLAGKATVIAFAAGLLIMTAAETRSQELDTRSDGAAYVSAAPRQELTPADGQWGKNMPEYGWIHNYVTAKKAEAKRSGAKAQYPCSVLDPDWGKNMPEYGWIHNYVAREKAEAYYVMAKKAELCK